MSTLSRLLGCISLPLFVGGSFPLVVTEVSVEKLSTGGYCGPVLVLVVLSSCSRPYRW